MPNAFNFFRIVCTLLTTMVLTSNALAVQEDKLNTLNPYLGDHQTFFKRNSFKTKDTQEISYVKFGQSAGIHGCVVISPGQGEASLKYLEVAHDLIEAGFSPIYSIDHLGQGFSSRLLSNRQKTHIVDFSDHVSNFQSFVDQIVVKDPACNTLDASTPAKKLFLLGHSMGGAVATRYLETVSHKTPFTKIALTSPMLQILFPEAKTDNSVLIETWLACHTPFGPKCTDFVPGSKRYNPDALFMDNPFTHSQPRFDFTKTLYSTWPDMQVGGVTIQWVHEATKATQDIRLDSNIKRIKNEVLIFQAAKDSIVDPRGQKEVCKKMTSCRIEVIDGAKHELLVETDSIRSIVMQSMVAFFKSSP